MDFIGRQKELSLLDSLKTKKISSLVCIMGRRRIGKSALIQHWGRGFKNFFEVQGLGPDLKVKNQDQLDHLASEMAIRFKIPKPTLTDWDMALDYLSRLTIRGEWLILLDEISWLGGGDPLFPSKLKSAWDIKFKKNSRLVLVLCGSVSSWIEENILISAHFLGRVSLSINLKELNLNEIQSFWKVKNYHLGDYESLMTLSITGGVPKYLEEITRFNPTSKNLASLCFDPSGLLYRDFKSIFNDVFKKKSNGLEKIIRQCLDQKLTPAALAKKLKSNQDSDLSYAIHILELSGFIARDYQFKPLSGTPEKTSYLRVKDNYTRFYLKIIEPLQKKIEAGGRMISDLSELKNIESIMGYQFENLLLANKEIIHTFLEILPQQIISSAPYVQKKTARTPQACQVDLLIHTSLDVFYLCEFKNKKEITSNVIRDVAKKMNAIKLPKRSALKPILIYSGEIKSSELEKIENYFYKIIYFQDLLR